MPDDITNAVERFKNEREVYVRAAKAVSRQVQTVADGAQIKCHVTHRAKDVRSFQKKLLIKQYADPWSSITDKAGVRAVVQLPSDVDRLSQEIQIAFGESCLEVQDKREVVDPSRLAYSGVHLQVRDSRPRAQSQVECEIQLRTIAQDAWSIVSHRILYKPVLALPPEAQHAAYRLVALVELFDQEVERLMESYSTVADSDVVALTELAETRFLPLAHSPSNSELSVIILTAIRECLQPRDPKGYAEVLDQFIAKHDSRLHGLYDEYGTHSAVSSVPQYVLFGQAESLVLLERLHSRPNSLLAAWRRSGLPDAYLEALAGAAGIAMPD